MNKRRKYLTILVFTTSISATYLANETVVTLAETTLQTVPTDRNDAIFEELLAEDKLQKEALLDMSETLRNKLLIAQKAEIEEQQKAAEEERIRAEQVIIDAQKLAEEQASLEEQRVAEIPRSQSQIAVDTLATIPNKGGMNIEWDSPDLQGSAGGVWSLEGNETILITRSKIDRLGIGSDVVRHEAFHVYQNRIATNRMAQYGNDFYASRDALITQLDAVYGAGKGIEYSADCGAIYIGGTWTHYTKNCSGTEAVSQSLIDGTFPNY